ncbi:MAG: hypothetical protein GY953_58815, partial [bacterium]|nr:hypothetical protein [bacterium]
GVAADAEQVTHPHSDHDAAYYFPGAPEVRHPGDHAVGAVPLTGVAGKHAEPYGKEFGQINTLWVVEADGVRIAHLGDTGPLPPEQVRALGRVDVLLIPVDGDEHILKYAEINAIRAALQPNVTVPMHYRLTAISELPASLGPVEPWLARRPEAERRASHRVELTRQAVGKAGQVWILPPSPAVRAWPENLHQAERERLAARSKKADAAIAHLRKAVKLAPESIRNSYGLAAAVAKNHPAEAIGILEKALTRANRMDREFTILSRTLLAELYSRQGRGELAAAQYRIVRAESYWLEPRQKAGAFLKQRK